MRRLFMLALAILTLGVYQPVAAQDVGADYAQGPGGYYRKSDRSGPWAIGPDGVPRLLGNTGLGLSGIVGSTTYGPTLVGKTSAGNLYGWHATFGGTAGYVAILNAAAAPASGATITPVECTPIAANSSFRTRQDIPDRYGVGVVLLATSSCTTYTPVTPQLMTSFVS